MHDDQGRDSGRAGRRDFVKVALAGAAGAGALLRGPTVGAARLQALTPGIKLSVQIPGAFSDEDLTFVKQVGVGYVNIPCPPNIATAETFTAMRGRVEAAGLKIWNIGNASVHNMEEVTLNLPGRDQKIEEYKQFLRNLGKAGLQYTTYAHMGNGIWSTARETTRGGASSRAFDLGKAEHGHWNGKDFKMPLSHGREYTKDEIWANYTYFIKAVAPVAEEVGVRIGIHPDDPPVPTLAGVPRCIFGNFDGYVRALQIANSPNVGVCLCCGTWLEGGKGMGKDVVQAIEHFGKKGKLWKIHFRNINAPLPHFVETFADDGYFEMYKIMRALRKVRFAGAVIGDHFPGMVGGPGGRASIAFTAGYMKGLLERANAEFGGPV